MLKLDRDLEDIPGHREFLKFFKAILIFSFSKREAMIFFRGKKDLKQSLNCKYYYVKSPLIWKVSKESLLMSNKPNTFNLTGMKKLN